MGSRSRLRLDLGHEPLLPLSEEMLNVMKCSVCQTVLMSRYPHIEPSGLAHSEAVCLDVVAEQRDAEETARKMLASDCAKYSAQVVELTAQRDVALAKLDSVSREWNITLHSRGLLMDQMKELQTKLKMVRSVLIESHAAFQNLRSGEYAERVRVSAIANIDNALTQLEKP